MCVKREEEEEKEEKMKTDAENVLACDSLSVRREGVEEEEEEKEEQEEEGRTRRRGKIDRHSVLLVYGFRVCGERDRDEIA